MVVEEVNSLVGGVFDVRLELVGWEDTVSVFGRPQATINRDLERCELFIGLMWRRWGTAPSVDGPYSSGFEEEFRSSVDRRNTSGSPEISLFFKEVSPDLLRDPGEDLRKVLAFKQELIKEKYLLFEEFSDIGDFERKLRRCLFKHINAARDREEKEDANQPPTESANEASGQPLLSSSEEDFLRGLLLKTESNPLNPQDIARFRLLAARFRLHGNDELVLGVHDANLLFQFKEKLGLGDAEKSALMITGLCHLEQENAPLWHWLKPIQSMLPFHTLTGMSAKRKGALLAMRLLREPVLENPPLTRQFFVTSWLGDDVDADDKVAALKYLASCGVHDDLPHIKAELKRNDSRTTEPAISTIVRIALRSGREEALREIYALEPSSVSKAVLDEISTAIDTIDTDLLRAGLSIKTREARNLVAKELFRRQEVRTEEAEALLGDDELSIRRLAIDHLVATGRLFSDEKIKDILTQKNGNFLARANDEEWVAYKRDRLRKLDKRTLKRMAEEESIFEVDVLVTYLSKDFRRSKGTLIRLVSDKFKSYFSEKLAMMERTYGASSDLVEKTRNLESFVRNGHIRKALDLLCSKGNSSDITTVRRALEENSIDYSDVDSNFLRRFGEWKDIRLIIDSLSRDRRRSLLTIDSFRSRSAAAQAIVALGSHRLRELLEIDMPPEFLARVISTSPDRDFLLLREETIMSLLNNGSEIVRKSCALKCVRCLSKTRIDSLLSSYVNSDSYRYYNVIHWLDIADSMPTTIARKIADRVLKDG
jgi:hypothetical protein